MSAELSSLVIGPSWVVATQRRQNERAQDEKIACHGADLSGRLSRVGIPARHRSLDHTAVKSRGANRKIVMKLVAGEDVSQRLDARIGEETPAIRAKAVRRIGVVFARGEADKRRMDELNGEGAAQWRVDSFSTENVPRALNVIVPGVEQRDESRDGAHIVLAVPVDHDESLVVFGEREGDRHTHLGAQPTRVALD